MNFFDITKEEACAVNLPATSREQILWEIARRAVTLPPLRKLSEEEIYTQLSLREDQGSTGFGGGIAIPHARLAKAEGFVFFIVTTAKGLDFKAIDRKKVRLFFVILGPEQQVREHLQLLAAVSNVITHSNVTRELLAAASASVLKENFLSKLQEQDKAVEQKKMKLLLIILYEDQFFYDILEYFLQEGLEGATIIDSSGMGRYISNIPLFASFIGFMNEQKNHSRTILTTISEDRVAGIVKGIERITGDLDQRQGAMIMELDLGVCKGTMKML